MSNALNRTIFTGDNLDVMRGLNSKSIDLIYLDPPFNSKANYSAPIGSLAAGAAFKDTWTLDDVDMAWHGLIAEEHPALYRVIDTAGLSHSKGMKSYLIMMGVRLLEMKRILKDTGSIYLHVDPNASHYLKLIMDCIFGKENFRNEVVWNYGGSGRGGKAIASQFPRNHDIILFYTVNSSTKYNKVFFESLFPIKKIPSHIKIDDDGIPFKTSPRGDYTNASIERLRKEKRIYETSNGVIRIKYFLKRDGKNIIEEKLAGDSWTDIPDMMHQPKQQRTGYPTQKPLALLERIIKASSNEGDMILDPFCGCATACVAAEKLNRKWIGIDLSSKAYELVNYRLGKSIDEIGDVLHRKDIPRRTDMDNLPKYTTHKHTLFGKQEGVCAGCEEFFPFRNFTVDHIIPKAKGGTDHEENLQLLCGACNSMKGKGSMEELIVKLKNLNIRN